MQNHFNVDIVDCLKNIFYETTEKHETDFKFDIIRIINEAKKVREDGEVRHLLWMARRNGTWCFPEGNVYIDGAPERKTWLGYQNEPDGISAFAVEITEVRDNAAFGNVYELVYADHVKQVLKYRFEPCSVDIELNDGEHVIVAIDKFNYYSLQLEFESINSISYVIKGDGRKYIEFLKDLRQLR